MFAEQNTQVTPGDLKKNCSTENDGVKYSLDGKKLLRYKRTKEDRKYVIPDSVEFICDGSFRNNRFIEKVTLPSCLKGIGKEAFKGCICLKEIIFPSNIRFIGDDAFNGTGVIDINLKDTQIETLNKNSFYDCDNLRYIELPESLRKIETGALYHTCIRNLVLPDSIIFIEEDAIYSDYMKSIKLPKNLENMNPMSFRRWSSVIEFYGIPNNFVEENGLLFSKDKKKLFMCLADSDTLVIPSSVEFIMPNFLYHSPKVSRVSFEKGSNLRQIQKEAFQCSKLRKITLPEGLEDIECKAFYATSLISINLPLSIKTIGDEAFAENSSLYEIWIPSTISSVGSDIFKDSEDLEYIKTNVGGKDILKGKIHQYRDIISEKPMEDLNEKEVGLGYWDSVKCLIPESPFIKIDIDEFANSINWKSLGVQINNINIETDDGRTILLFFEISGKIKQDFELNIAVYDKKNRIRKTFFLEYVSSTSLKYQGKFETIISGEFDLQFDCNEISKIKFFVE